MSESETRRVELRDVAPEAFEAIVTYVYTGRVRLAAGKKRKKEGTKKRRESPMRQTDERLIRENMCTTIIYSSNCFEILF